jgi:hypothetical protein
MSDLLRTILYFVGFVIAAIILYKLGVLLIAEL